MTDHIDDLRAMRADTRRRRPVTADGIVVHPDRVRCFWTLPPDDSDFSPRRLGSAPLLSVVEIP